MALKSLSTSELRRELERREKNASKLQAKRDKLLQELNALDAELASLGGARGRSRGRSSTGRAGPRASATGRRRARNEMSLPDAIAHAMEVRAVVSPQEAAELVKKNGFKTTSKNFNMMVSNALSKDKRFRRVARGQYERIK